nr:DUF3017 domain-containing protein [Murinocardiopsis flavida]
MRDHGGANGRAERLPSEADDADPRAESPGAAEAEPAVAAEAAEPVVAPVGAEEAEEPAAPEPDTGEEPAGAERDPAGTPPAWLVQVPYFLVLATLGAGTVVVAAAYFKRGPALIAIALLLAAGFRLFLPPERVGLLAVRERWTDVATLVTLAVLLIVLAWVAPQL